MISPQKKRPHDKLLIILLYNRETTTLKFMPKLEIQLKQISVILFHSQFFPTLCVFLFCILSLTLFVKNCSLSLSLSLSINFLQAFFLLQRVRHSKSLSKKMARRLLCLANNLINEVSNQSGLDHNATMHPTSFSQELVLLHTKDLWLWSMLSHILLVLGMTEV